MKRLGLVLFFTLAPLAYGEEFLGIEKGTEETDENAKTESTQQATPATGTTTGKWSGYGGLWPGVNQLSAALTIIYSFNPYLSVDTHGYYRHFKTKTYKGAMYGPEIDVVARLTNPTILTPLLGVGVGYDRWARAYEGDLFDDAGSATAVAFAGAQINLTKHFGIQGMRKQKIYLADAPISFDDRRTEEPKSQMINSVGFVLVF